MARETYIPDRGDVVHLNFQPSAGREQTGRRYGLVISTKAYNRPSGLFLVCPITSKVKGYPFEVELNVEHVKGVVLVDHLRSCDYRDRGTEYVARCPHKTLDRVVELLLELIDPSG